MGKIGVDKWKIRYRIMAYLWNFGEGEGKMVPLKLTS